MKKFTAALLGLIIALTCFFSVGGAGAFYENELNADGDDPYLPLVKNKCEAAKEVWGKSKNEDEFKQKARDIYYFLYDLNGDLIPELIFGDVPTAANSDYKVEIGVTDIYVYVDDRLVKMYDEEHWDLERVLYRDIFNDGVVRTKSTDGETICYTIMDINKDASETLERIFYKNGDSYRVGGLFGRNSDGSFEWAENYPEGDFYYYLDRNVDGGHTGAGLLEPKWKRIDEYEPGEYAAGFGGRKLEEMTNAFDLITTKIEKKEQFYTDRGVCDIETTPNDPYLYVVKERLDKLSKVPKQQDDGFIVNDDFEFARFGQNYYSLYDINGDGVEELLLACYEPFRNVGDGNSSFAFVNDAIYTIKDGKAETLFENKSALYDFLERTIYTNGVIRTKSNDPYEPSYSYFRITDGGKELIASVIYDPPSVNIWFDPAKYEHVFYENGEIIEETITAEEFHRIRAELEKDLVPVELDWHPLETYAQNGSKVTVTRTMIIPIGLICALAVTAAVAVVFNVKKRKNARKSEETHPLEEYGKK